MRIVINSRFLTPGKQEAYGYFMQEVFCRIANNNPQHEFYFLFDGADDKTVIASANIHHITIKPITNHPLLYRFWYNWQLPALLKKLKADVLVSADGLCSFATKLPQCLVVHDLAFIHEPHLLAKSHQRYYKKNTPLSFRKARTIVTVSEFLKQDIGKTYDVIPEKISVVQNVPNSIFIPLQEEEKETIKQKYSSGTEYFLCAGTVHPENNFIGLLKAYSLFKKKQKSSMKLVIVGGTATGTNSFTKLLQTYKFRNDVILTAHLPKTELAMLVAAAYAIIYPSWFEGFGSPPLEALQCHVPAVVAGTGSLPEIGGNACLYFNPNNIEEITEKITRLYKDEELRKELIQLGRERLTQFTLDKTAAALWDCILKTSSTDSLTFAK
jgi:glycosyltransferase involved in cell wall biosynthesis